MFVSRHQNVGEVPGIKIANIMFVDVSQFKYLETTLTIQNLIQEEFKSRFKTGNACYHSVQNLLFSCLLLKNLRIRIYIIQYFSCEGELRGWHDVSYKLLAGRNETYS
jgi:hypothetical protein